MSDDFKYKEMRYIIVSQEKLLARAVEIIADVVDRKQVTVQNFEKMNEFLLELKG